MRIRVAVVHAIPGRTRLRLPRIPSFAAQIKARLLAIPYIYSCVYTKETSSLLLYHHPAATTEDLTRFIQFQWLQYVRTASRAKINSPSTLKKQLLSVGIAASAYVIDRLLFPGMIRVGWGRLFNLTTLATLFAAKDILWNGTRGALINKQLNADTLTTTALAAAILKGNPGSGFVMILLSGISELLTEYTAERTRKHITDMLKVDIPYAWLVQPDGREARVPMEQIQPGDTVTVFLGEKISVDGRVVDGSAAIDESSITGEFLPKEVACGSYVYAGTIVKSGTIRIQVQHAGDDTVVTRIVKMIEQAQSKKAPVQHLADRMANKLVPISFLMAGIVYLTTRSWDRVLNMLFIDFSCGLKLSTATAISAAIGKAAKQGILVKGGQYVERLAAIDTIIFDKTGTLTEGSPEVKEVIPYYGFTVQEVIAAAASAEEHSSHPIAESILRQAKDWNLSIPKYDFLQTIVGRGIYAVVEGHDVLIGSAIFMEESDIDLSVLNARFKHDERNAVYVAYDGLLMGVVHIHDPLRSGMSKAIHRLRRLGVDEVLMLTGDRKHTAQQISASLFLDRYYAEALPTDKAGIVKRYRDQGASVMMVGDGVNDAPALAYANVGITMGRKKTDIAVEASDVTITSDDPGNLPAIVNLSKQTMRIIHQNIGATLLVNSTAMLLGALGTISPVAGALIHNSATIAVVLNSTRILGMEVRK
ncbi:heavy metal translocating P-type ATPase [Paenibacillus turpanensis]|uniref:heavy metal translocating P-type ATPase n=1 Tax=Paenibacillus turpanensis TaxID=2689078 RepID=UPI0014094984|nr:heavy metal translocating P-type ATPase [Paenibacillus turpanensis]